MCQAAAEALGKLGPSAKEAAPALEKTLHDGDKAVAQSAAKALDAINGSQKQP